MPAAQIVYNCKTPFTEGTGKMRLGVHLRLMRLTVYVVRVWLGLGIGNGSRTEVGKLRPAGRIQPADTF